MNPINIPRAIKRASAQHFENKKLTLNIPTSLREVQDNYCIQALAQTTLEFCRETTLHGVKQVVIDIQELSAGHTRYVRGLASQRIWFNSLPWFSLFSITIRHRRFRKVLSLVIWSSACIMGAVFAIVLMNLVWKRFQTTPTITTVETNNYPIWNVPFPAVTICNINKVYSPATKNITEKL